MPPDPRTLPPGPELDAAPVRIRRSRAKGSRLVSPNGLPVLCVTRPGRWGNPFSGKRIGQYVPGEVLIVNAAHSVNVFRRALLAGELSISIDDVRRELRGKNLACWCKTGDPCHADVLLQVANGHALIIAVAALAAAAGEQERRCLRTNGYP